jgi:hypothetical protein
MVIAHGHLALASWGFGSLVSLDLDLYEILPHHDL